MQHEDMESPPGDSPRPEFEPVPAVSCSALRLSEPLQRFALVAAVLILFTSSFDIFLVLHGAGNYRFCQLILLPIVGLACLKASSGHFTPVLGSLALCIWFLFQAVFVPTTDFWPKSAGYCLWLLLNIGMMFAFVQLFSDDAQGLRTLLRWYVYSFGFVAACGILQLLLPVMGFPGLLVTQWWIPELLPRVNGFSYEPSYFASYLLIGFVFIGSLTRAKSNLLSSRGLLSLRCLSGLGIIISSSRLGIIFLLADVLVPNIKPWLQFLGYVGRLRTTRPRFRALISSSLSLGCIAALCGWGVVALRNNPLVLLSFLNGTGVGDTAAHSVVERESSFEKTLDVIAEHPFIGRSLGGISAAIAEQEGSTIRSFEEAKLVEGMNVFAESLAASGVIGFVPFLYFVAVTIRKPLQLSRIVPEPDSVLLRGLVRSLVFAWAILQFNQNILRTYLWVHLAILATVYAASLRKTTAKVGTLLTCDLNR